MNTDKMLAKAIEKMNKPESRARIAELTFELYTLLAPGATVHLGIMENRAVILPGQDQTIEHHMVITRPMVWGELSVKQKHVKPLDPQQN